MGNPKAFLTVPRQDAGYRPIHERIADFGEVEQTLNTSDRRLQASRCMDCGVPFAIGLVRLAIVRPNFKMPFTRVNGRWHTKYLPLRMIFPNLRAAFARHCVKKVVCLSCL